MTDTPEPLAALLGRFGAPPTVPRVSLADAMAQGADPLDVLAYLAGLGSPVRALDDLLTVNADPDEDEVRAFRVREGVAVVVASQGEWVLFTP